MRVFFNIPRFVPAYGAQVKRDPFQSYYDTGETLEQFLDKIGPIGRQSIVSSLQEGYLQQLPNENLQDPKTKMELALIDRLIFPTLESGKLPTEDELKEQISDIENPHINNLQELEGTLITVVQEAYKNGVHFF